MGLFRSPTHGSTIGQNQRPIFSRGIGCSRNGLPYGCRHHYDIMVFNRTLSGLEVQQIADAAQLKILKQKPTETLTKSEKIALKAY